MVMQSKNGFNKSFDYRLTDYVMIGLKMSKPIHNSIDPVFREFVQTHKRGEISAADSSS
jgi:hypothetical protein